MDAVSYGRLLGCGLRFLPSWLSECDQGTSLRLEWLGIGLAVYGLSRRFGCGRACGDVGGMELRLAYRCS